MILELHPSREGDMDLAQGSSFIGYWAGARDDPEGLPDPHDYIDESWDSKERAYVAELLRVGTEFCQWMGSAYCRCCKPEGDRGGNGSKCLTFDGSWVWPEGFAHYIKDHAVRPPQEFIDYLLGVPEDLVAELRGHTKAKEAIAAKWEPHFDGTGCPDKGVDCKFEVRGPDSIHCEKKMGLGISGSYKCLWAEDQFRADQKTERARHWAALEPFRKKEWTTAWEHRLAQ